MKPVVPRVTEVYRDRSGQWRWRVRARNGRIVETSGEAFASRSSARRSARRLGYPLVERD